MTAEEFAGRLEARQTGDGWIARCPAHDDHNPSLSIHEGEDAQVLLKCFAGCAATEIVGALGLTMADLFPHRDRDVRGGGDAVPHYGDATPQGVARGCTLASYAEAKKLPVPALVELGLTDISYQGRPAIRIPYHNPDGSPASIRFRLAMAKGVGGADQRFAWRKGDKPMLYGLERLDVARTSGSVALVEGESDTHTLYCAGVPALGIPGAGVFKEDWAGHFEGLATIYVVVEPDRGGDAVLRWIGRSAIRDRVRLVRLAGFKDVSELWTADRSAFADAWSEATRVAEPWPVFAERQNRERASAAWAICRSLAEAPDILAHLDESLESRGVVGERRVARLVYLATVSRAQARPVSIAVKGPSSCGKSHVVQQVLEHFPPDAYYALSAMSERALAYSEEPLKHRMLVLYEAAGMSGETASYLVRSLLSEGCVRYETVERGPDGIRPRLIEREGPTGLITTTTAVHLHPENETRLLSVPATDTPQQTRQVLRALSQDRLGSDVDLERWRALQTWLLTAERRVVVPFAPQLAEAIPPVATRLRRDFSTLLALVKAHAALHQATRARDDEGRVVATLADYEAVYDLTWELFEVAVRASVSTTVRETVEAIAYLNGPSRQPASLTTVAGRLEVDVSTASRRVQVALDAGYVENLETRNGRPMRLVIGEPLPEAVTLLPKPESLMPPCTVAGAAEGSASPQCANEEVPLDGCF